MQVYLDVGHNLPALTALIKGFRSEMKVTHQLWIVCGFSMNKEKKPLFELLGRKTHRVYVISTNHYRLTNAVELYHEAGGVFDGLYRKKASKE